MRYEDTLVANRHLLRQRKDKNKEQSCTKLILALFFVVSIIFIFGVTMLYSASYEKNLNLASYFYLKKQLMWGAIGALLGVGAFFIGYKNLIKSSIFLLIPALILLIIALFCPAINGAHRWIKIPVIHMSLQASELAKIPLLLFLAKFCAEKTRFLEEVKLKRLFHPPFTLLFQILLIVVVPVLIVVGKDLGTTLLVVATIGIMLFTAGLQLRWLILGGAASIILASIFIFNSPERQARITSFLDPERCQFDEGLQLWNSMLAIGSGGLTGVGLTESRIKAKYLPEAHTDFILSIVGEEEGFVGMVLVIILYGAFFTIATMISLHSKTKAGMLLGLGITTIITLQALINIIVITGSGPTKGMPAPFISYGGSNLVMCIIGVSLLLNIAYEPINPTFNEEMAKKAGSFIDRLNLAKRKQG